MAQHPKRKANQDARCPKHPDKDIRKLVRDAWDAGWWVERASNNYLKCYPPGDAKMVSVPSTPHTKGRRLDNLRGEFRKSGLDV